MSQKMSQNNYTAPKLFLCFSHTLTEEQAKDAYETLKINEIVKMPDEIQPHWSRIPPELKDISEHLRFVKMWIHYNAKAMDYVLVQGDSGAVFQIANFCLLRGIIPVYSTTDRVSTEYMNDKGVVVKKSEFSHVIFRKY